MPNGVKSTRNVQGNDGDFFGAAEGFGRDMVEYHEGVKGAMAFPETESTVLDEMRFELKQEFIYFYQLFLKEARAKRVHD